MRTLNPAKLITVACLWFIGTAATGFGQRDLKDIPVPEPDLEMQTFRLPEDFEVNLFAADPMIAKPIQMNFDPSGRLWIVSSEVYPHIEPGAEARDKVIVLEDLDHDGTSDKTHVFASGLLIPTGIAPGDGGAYVANSTELLHLTDTDGDLKADSRKVVLSGFGTEDTHHILHTLRWGPDGNLYFNQSIYIHSHIETPWGVRRLNAGGIWQFRPETLELGVFMRGLVNTWGHDFDRFGQSFATDGAGGDGINYIVPGAYYVTAADAPKLLRGLNPGSPKHCGLEILETPMLPPEWQGSAITNDFRGHRVCRFKLADDRSGYVSREQKEVIWSDHVAFRPIDVKLGPDGAIYIADWYNPIIQHGEVDFRDPRRDRTHGRIWRVTWKGAPQREHLDIAALSNSDLLALLAGDDNFRRQMAKQVLRERGDRAADDVRAWQQTIPETADGDHQRLESLWVDQCLRNENLTLLQKLLKASDGRVRAAAVRVLSQWKHLLPDNGLQLLSELVNDSHPRVRLEAVRAVSFSPSPKGTGIDDGAAVELAMRATDHPTDTFLDYAIWLTTHELSAGWLPRFQAGEIDFNNNVQHILAAFAGVSKGAPIEFLLGKLYADSTTQSQRNQVVSLIATSGTPPQISQMVVAGTERGDHSVVRAALMETRQRNNMQVVVPQNVIASALESDNTELRKTMLEATGQWRLSGQMAELKQLVNSSDASVDDRTAAATGIALAGGMQAEESLQQLATAKSTPVALQVHSAALLTGLNATAGATVCVKLLAELSVDDSPQNLIPGFMVQKNGDKVLATALTNTSMDAAVARQLLSVVRESGRAAPELEAALKLAGRLTSRKSISPEERTRLLALSRNEASAESGEVIFRNVKLGCLKCHAIGGAGGKVGPDMVSLGGSAQPDYLLESLLNPNAKVKENYHTVVVATAEGKLLSGVQVKQSKQEVVLRTATDELVSIARKDIEEIAQGVSLMPEGLVDTLTDQELADLVLFLSELGRTEDYKVGLRQLARTWQFMQPTDAAAFRLRRTSYAMAATDDPSFEWSKCYSMVSGQLPMSDIPSVSVRNRVASGNRGVGFVRTYIAAETAGSLQLKLNDLTGLKLRINDVPVDLEAVIVVELPVGTHRLTFTVDQAVRSMPLELEIVEDGTTAIAKFVN